MFYSAEKNSDNLQKWYFGPVRGVFWSSYIYWTLVYWRQIAGIYGIDEPVHRISAFGLIALQDRTMTECIMFDFPILDGLMYVKEYHCILVQYQTVYCNLVHSSTLPHFAQIA